MPPDGGKIEGSRPRLFRSRAVSVLVAPMLELPETPRNTYMNAVKLMLFFIELLKASAIMGDGDRLEILPEMKIF